MVNRYLLFYFHGHAEDIDGLSVDIEPTINRVIETGEMRSLSYDLAKSAITKFHATARTSRQDMSKAKWMADNTDDIIAAGGDTEKAWAMYLSGRTDALAHMIYEMLLPEVAEEFEKSLDESDEDEEEHEGPDGESDEDEEEDEGEEEEEEEEFSDNPN
jgi:hypothetical protein